jgi:ribosomal protein L37E
MPNSERCTKCGKQTITLESTGRKICQSCGWTSDKKTTGSVQNQLGAVFVVVGAIAMFYGLGMDASTCQLSGLDCVNNIGRLNSRSNVVNIGGFLMVAGAVLAKQS